jgi:NitT/TauT family transport system permease protein
MKKILFGSLMIFLILLIWELYALRVNNIYIFPTVTHVFNALLTLLSDKSTYMIIVNSFTRLIISMILAGGIGIGLGLLAGQCYCVDYFLNPIVVSLRTLPVASVIIIILILFARNNALFVITFLMLFPIIYEAAKQGVLHIDKNLKDALLLEQVHFIYKQFYIVLPLSFPYIKTAILQSIGLGFKVLVMAEFISQADNSIGRALYFGSISINYANVFAWTIILIVIVTIIENLVKKLNTI